MSHVDDAIPLRSVGVQSKRPLYEKIFWRTLIYLFTGLLALLFMLPFFWTVSSAFKSVGELYIFPPTWFPEQWQPQNFVTIWQLVPFAQWTVNSTVVAVLNIIAEVAAAAAVAYGFSRFQFFGRNFLFVVLLSTMMLPIYVTIIPRFLIFKTLGWIDTLAPPDCACLLWRQRVQHLPAAPILHDHPTRL
jgi:multiple sugar transport system permease protein